ncbi:MAG TPA: ABC transporter ATP-binding protein [Beijerinckiaceae bacterium]|nr:ABC transporter ATP-binding protein [Beijerinckiaceae bacterium]
MAQAALALAPDEVIDRTIKMEVRHLDKRFDNPITGQSIEALQDINLSVNKGEFLTIVGPSGCGKTTLLRIFAGLIPPTEGMVLYNGNPVLAPSPKVGFVFQSDNLMPWRNVWDNVGFGPELRGESKKIYGPRIEYLLDLVGLSGFAKYYPHQLSGGMRQRVNLARALAIEPDVLLMDEPFAALDAQTREIMQDELLRIWRETGNTVVFITHQIDEAIFLADRLLILAARPGRVQELLTIDIPRPRALEVKRTARFTEFADHVWSSIERQVRASIRQEQFAGAETAPAAADIAKE